ncbi:hypothetical protein [Aliidongia dinghuensis]|uniref:hypothetical protein n=1 Tax=Aliidongia dinghuensis TaxID=1867774 RepID=UPI001668CBB8|nr:hypothetical protein [Aliidongia dinghuensis]
MRQSDGFKAVKVLLIEQAMGRSVLRSALGTLEITDIEEWNAVKTEPLDLAALADFDLIIANIDDGDEAAAQMLRSLRNGTIPGNPFVPAIITCGSSLAATVRAAVDAGADAVVLKPYSLKQIMDPVAALVARRRPFVVTVDYVGPERRTGQRSGQAIEQIDVPNRLAAKIRNLDPVSLMTAESEAWALIERQRTLRIAFQALFLVRLAAAAGSLGAGAARRDLARLPALARELSTRIDDPDELPLLKSFTSWLGTFPSLADDAARRASCDEAGRALGTLLAALGSGEAPAEAIAQADAAVFSYCQRLTAA